MRAFAGRVMRLLKFAARRAGEERIAQVAASLTFTTVLSLVPMLAVVFALFTAFPLFAQFRLALDEFMINSLMPATVANTVMNYLSQFAMQASRLSTLGGLFLLATAISLIITIDKALNDIWHVTRQRPVIQRTLVYWAVLSLGPVMLGASLWTTSFLARESLGLVGDMSAWTEATLTLLPMILMGLSLSALFLVVPNRHIDWRDAVYGGFSAAIVLELLKNLLAWYVGRFPTYTMVYGTFAILPIFLLWLYFSWLVVLFAATVSASLPLIRLGRHGANRRQGAPFIDAINTLRILMEARGKIPPGMSTRAMLARLRLDHDELIEVLEALASIGYVVRVGDGSKERWAMVCDPDQASLGPVFDRLLLDRRQPVLTQDPGLQRIVYGAWRDAGDAGTTTISQALAQAAEGSARGETAPVQPARDAPAGAAHPRSESA
jgi:membrane protein